MKITEETTLGELEDLLEERDPVELTAECTERGWYVSARGVGYTNARGATLAEALDKLIQMIDSAVDR